MPNVFDKRIKPCICTSEDVFMRKNFNCKPPQYSLKCNYCKREQKQNYPTWDEAIKAWNESVKQKQMQNLRRI